MASKDKTARLSQKALYEKQLNVRISSLKEKGIASASIAKDTTVRSLRAMLRETEERLSVIAALEAKNEEMARIKAEKLAAPKKEKVKKKAGAAEEDQGESKRKQKKAAKKSEKSKPSADS